MFYFNIHVHNFISGCFIVQHYPNFTYICINIYTHTEQKPQADLKNGEKQPATAKVTPK